MTAITHLTCEYLTNPLGIDVAAPRLGWRLETDRRGARQTAYQVRVASSPDGPADLWDSGRVESDQSAHVAYAGAPLTSRQRVWWRVRAWDETGAMTESAPAWWEMGLLARDDWRATWVGAPLMGGPRTSVQAPYLRTTFAADGPVAAARLYITALGLYEASLNGAPVGDLALAPGWTDYDTRVRYQVYDVTDTIVPGENALGAVLGDGWYCGHLGWETRQHYGDRPLLLAQLEITYADGRRQTVASDASWRYGLGPILANDLYMGEHYDARQEMPGWDAPGFDTSAWYPVLPADDPGVALVATNAPLIRTVAELTPVADPVRKGSGWVFDLGQNMVGRIRLRVAGPAGTALQIRYAEVTNPDGSIYTANLRGAKNTDTYTLKGEGVEVWEPRFTFHGFRYVEVAGFPGTPTRDMVTGIVLCSDLEPIGAFACSDPLVTQLQHNIQWGQRGNFLDVPTDCPQRDERLGWTGDAQAFARTAAYNLHVAGFFAKWLRDMRDDQLPNGGIPSTLPANHLGINKHDGGPAWSDACVIVPWVMYRYYGDTRILADHYDAMVRYLDFLESTSRDGIRLYEGSPHPHAYGDWLALDGSGHVAGGTPNDLIATAFFAYSARLLGQIAEALGKQDDARRYADLFARVRAAFQRRYVTPDGLMIGPAQTRYVLGLYFDLLPDDLRQTAAHELVRDITARGMHLATGFVGTPYLMHVLTETGHLDTAYALLAQTSWPSWLYAVTQGATTIWERWDGWTHDRGFQDAGMNSFNHYAYGAVGDWLYSVVAGIDADAPGYKTIRLAPRHGGSITSARGALQTAYGEVVSDWRLEGDRFVWDVVVPPNTTATARIPAVGVTESGTPLAAAADITNATEDADATTCTLAAGHYHFEGQMARE